MHAKQGLRLVIMNCANAISLVILNSHMCRANN